MPKYSNIPRLPHKNIWQLLKSIPTATTPDARWGSVQIVMSIALFLFGLVLATIAFYGSDVWRA